MRKKYLKIFLIYLGAACLIFICTHQADAKTDLRVVKCDESRMVDVYVKPNFGTVINFPIKPDNVVMGSQRQFSIEYIKNDVALTALASNSHTNLFVYLLGRRCGFNVVASSSRHDSLVQVRDPEDSKMKVLFK